MKRVVFFCVAACLAIAGPAPAQEGPIKQRQALMKKNGDAAKLASAMLKGEKPYDAAAAAEAMSVIGKDMEEFVTLFPEGSAKGSDAKEDIWQNKADFEAYAQETKKAAAAAANAAADGKESFQVAFLTVGQNCKGCHEKYRVEKK
jgi:cytochrome c556